MTEVPNPKHELILLICLAAMQFAHIVDFMLIMPLGPVLESALQMDTAEFGLLVSSYNLSAAVIGFLMVFWLDRLNRRNLVLGLFTGFLLATGLSGLAFSFETMLLARLIVGAFGGILTAAVYSIVADVIPEARRGAAMGTIVSAFSVASVLGIPFSLWLATRYTWRTPFFALALGSVLILFLAMRVLPDLPPRSYRPVDAFEQIQNVFRPRLHQLCLLVTAFLVLSGFCLIPYISMSMVFNGNVLEEELPYLYLFGGIATLCSSRLLGHLSDRYGRRPVFMALAIVSVGPALWIANFRDDGIVYASLAVALFMVFNSGRMIVATSNATIVVEPEVRGSFMSLNTCVQQLCSAAGAYLASCVIVKEPATQRLLHMPWLGGLSVVFTVGAIFCFLRVLRQHAALEAQKPHKPHIVHQKEEASS